MKNSVRLDVVSANTAVSKKRIREVENSDIATDLGSEWTKSRLGAKLKCNVDNVSATASIFKKNNGKYGCKLDVDSSYVGQTLDSDTPSACVENILAGVDAVAKMCLELRQDAYLKYQEEQSESLDESESIQKQLDGAASEGMTNLSEED